MVLDEDNFWFFQDHTKQIDSFQDHSEEKKQ